MTVLDKNTSVIQTESQHYYCEKMVEDRFRKKHQKICSKKIDEILRIAKVFKEYVLRKEHRFYKEGVENLLTHKNYDITSENIVGKVYVLSLRIVSLIFFDDIEIFNRNQIYLVDLGFIELFKFNEHKNGVLKRRFFLQTNVLLGKGGNHFVYKGYDVIKDREVAVRKSCEKRINWMSDISIHQQLSLEKTPAIVKIHSIMESKKILFLELFQNDLNNLKVKDLDNKQINSVILQILISIKMIHDKGLVIRDIKPDNILYRIENENVVISLSDLESIGKSTFYNYIGTYSYLPIDAFNQKVHPDLKKIDCWSLGLTLLNFITGVNNSFSHLMCDSLIEWVNIQISNVFKMDLKTYFECIENEFPKITTNDLYIKLKQDLKTSIHLNVDTEENHIFAHKIINIVMKEHQFYGHWMRHYTDLFNSLKKIDHPIFRIILSLMDIDVKTRLSIDDALHQFNFYLKNIDDFKALLKNVIGH